MKKYKVLKLTSNTSKADGARLVKNLTGVTGVTAVELRPEKGEVWISSQPTRGPKSEQVQSAATKAGFTLAVAD